MRPTLNTISIPLSSYLATIWWKIFRIILNKDLNLWRRNINQVQYSCVSQWHTSSTIAYIHMCTSSKFSKFIHNQLKFEKIQKIFQSPVQVNWAWKNFQKFSKFNSSKTWVKKIQKILKVFNAWLWNVRKKIKNILSPNRKWIPNMAEKIWKFKSIKSMNANQKIQNKFKVQTDWDIFKLFLKVF